MTTKTEKTAVVTALTLGVALTLGATVAMAAGGKGGAAKGMWKHDLMRLEFVDLDVNKDGKITADDLKAQMVTRFGAMDADGDGEVSADEMKAHRAAMMAQGQGGHDLSGKRGKRMERMAQKMISKRDANGNGTLSLEEMTPDQARFEKMVRRFDEDGDMAISQAEFEAAREAFAARGRGGKEDCDKAHRAGKTDG